MVNGDTHRRCGCCSHFFSCEHNWFNGFSCISCVCSIIFWGTGRRSIIVSFLSCSFSFKLSVEAPLIVCDFSFSVVKVFGAETPGAHSSADQRTCDDGRNNKGSFFTPNCFQSILRVLLSSPLTSWASFRSFMSSFGTVWNSMSRWYARLNSLEALAGIWPRTHSFKILLYFMPSIVKWTMTAWILDLVPPPQFITLSNTWSTILIGSTSDAADSRWMDAYNPFDMLCIYVNLLLGFFKTRVSNP